MTEQKFNVCKSCPGKNYISNVEMYFSNNHTEKEFLLCKSCFDEDCVSKYYSQKTEIDSSHNLPIDLNCTPKIYPNANCDCPIHSIQTSFEFVNCFEHFMMNSRWNLCCFVIPCPSCNYYMMQKNQKQCLSCSKQLKLCPCGKESFDLKLKYSSNKYVNRVNISLIYVSEYFSRSSTVTSFANKSFLLLFPDIIESLIYDYEICLMTNYNEIFVKDLEYLRNLLIESNDNKHMYPKIISSKKYFNDFTVKTTYNKLIGSLGRINEKSNKEMITFDDNVFFEVREVLISESVEIEFWIFHSLNLKVKDYETEHSERVFNSFVYDIREVDSRSKKYPIKKKMFDMFNMLICNEYSFDNKRILNRPGGYPYIYELKQISTEKIFHRKLRTNIYNLSNLPLPSEKIIIDYPKNVIQERIRDFSDIHKMNDFYEESLPDKICLPLYFIKREELKSSSLKFSLFRGILENSKYLKYKNNYYYHFELIIFYCQIIYEYVINKNFEDSIEENDLDYCLSQGIIKYDIINRLIFNYRKTSYPKQLEKEFDTMKIIENFSHFLSITGILTKNFTILNKDEKIDSFDIGKTSYVINSLNETTAISGGFVFYPLLSDLVKEKTLFFDDFEEQYQKNIVEWHFEVKDEFINNFDQNYMFLYLMTYFSSCADNYFNNNEQKVYYVSDNTISICLQSCLLIEITKIVKYDQIDYLDHLDYSFKHKLKVSLKMLYSDGFDNMKYFMFIERLFHTNIDLVKKFDIICKKCNFYLEYQKRLRSDGKTIVEKYCSCSRIENEQ